MTRLKPLPDCEGPKLEAFTDDLFSHDVEFLDVTCGENIGLHSQIFKTRIDGKLYCLKIFTDDASEVFETSDKGFPMDEFWRPAEGQPEDVTALIRMHTTPFYNECRAFGRLKEMEREHLAVKAYGYVQFHADERYDKLVLDSERRKERDGVEPAECIREPIEPRAHIGRGVRFDGTVDTRPVMGIVKDWVAPRTQDPSPDDWEAKMPHPRRMPAMLRDLHEMHRIGIVNRDLNPEQYIDGVLLDFSKAWTMPHALGPEGGILPCWTLPSMAAWDLWCFQQFIVNDWNWMARQRNGTARGDKKRLPISRLRAYPAEHQPPGAGAGGGPPGPGRTREGVLGTLRPRAHRHGPFLPLLDTPHMEFHKLPFTVWPRHDPSAFDWRGIMLRAKGRRAGGSEGTTVCVDTAEDPRSGRGQPGQDEKKRAGEGRETGRAGSGESVDSEEGQKTSGKGKAEPPFRGTRKRARHSQC